MIEKNTFVLKLLGFNQQEFSAFSAVLSLSETKLNHAWRIIDVEESNADFFVLADHGSQLDQIIIKKDIPTERCLFCTDKICATKDNIISSNSHLVPRLSSLIETLNHIALNVVVQNAVVHNNVESCFDLEENGILKQLLQNQSPLLITLKNQAIEIYVHPTDSVYFCHYNLQQLSACTLTETQLLSQSLSINELNTQVTQAQLSPQPLNDLIWRIAFNSSRGHLLKGHCSQDIIYLTNWPNLELPESQRYVRLAAFMQHNAVSLHQAANKLAVPLEEAFNFYNACYLIGLIEKADKTEIHEKQLSENERFLLVTIANRLQTVCREHEELS
ncbi:MAG: hypothetical protein WAX77_01500 [Methylococcaceae bacterium]